MLGAGLLGAGLASGCGLIEPGQVRVSAPAPARPESLTRARPSSELADYYRRIEDERVAGGLMRRDDGTADAPFSASILARNYIKIALYDEYLQTGTRFAARRTASALRRWDQPVAFRVEFGDSVPPAMRARDRAAIADLVRDLSQSARHPMRLLPAGRESGGNFHILVLDEAERRAIAPRLEALVPGIDQSAIRLVTDMPRETFCLAMAFSRDGSSTYTEAFAIVRAEHPDLTRLACYHEELAQGLGLAADSDGARPSIFNDDQEFAFLTRHDRLLLRLHHDTRLRPGMTEREARPIVHRIASELVAGES
ncbi:MAG: Protein of unknown function (DUF2927) [Rhodobacteraceae bacterium HLUCCA12]|nr:MAG: Protein of unknown function (DUF2927) [Rhodobacteraceae bacterium HLUCCA12]